MRRGALGRMKPRLHVCAPRPSRVLCTGLECARRVRGRPAPAGTAASWRAPRPTRAPRAGPGHRPRRSRCGGPDGRPGGCATWRAGRLFKPVLACATKTSDGDNAGALAAQTAQQQHVLAFRTRFASEFLTRYARRSAASPFLFSLSASLFPALCFPSDRTSARCRDRPSFRHSKISRRTSE